MVDAGAVSRAPFSTRARSGPQQVRYCGPYAHGERKAPQECREELGRPPLEVPKELDWQTYCERRGMTDRARCRVCGHRFSCTDAFRSGGIPPPLAKEQAFSP